jgi:hypothetical protein
MVEEHEGELQHLPWPTQSPDLNITEPLWSVSETRVRSRFQSLRQIEDILKEKWYEISLETVQNLYKSIPSRILTEMRAKEGPTPD